MWISLLFALLSVIHTISAQPILSINQTTLIQCNQTINQSTNLCSSCNQSASLPYPSVIRPINCQSINQNLSYSTINQRIDLYYQTNQSINQCQSSNLVASFNASQTDCSVNQITKQFYVINQTMITNQPLLDQPTTHAAGCSLNCSNPTCPANSTQSTSQVNVLLSLSIPCPVTCDPLFASRFDQTISQCFDQAYNQSVGQATKLCACYSTSYFSKVASGCYSSDQSSIDYMNQLSMNYTQFCAGINPITQSSSSSSTGQSIISSSSTGQAVVDTPKRGIDEGALIGGVLGGLGGIIVLIFVLRYCMRYQKGTNIERFRNQANNRSTQSNEMVNRAINQPDDESDDESSDEFESSDDEDDLPAAVRNNKAASRV